MLQIVVAIDEHNAIGRQGDLLCHMSADLQHFKQLTTGHTILMGKRTYLSFPRRPLPNRRHIVLTSDTCFHEEGIEVAHNEQEAWALIRENEQTFIIGGGKVYHDWIDHADLLYVTHIHHVFEDADTYFPAIDSRVWSKIEEEHHTRDEKNPYDYTYTTYKRIKQ